jgi:DNA uptake protein ComE-like DNA-binding protein
LPSTAPSTGALRDTAHDCDDRPIDVQPAGTETAPTPATLGDTDGGCVDINRARRGQLQRIAQIGPKRANELIAHRAPTTHSTSCNASTASAPSPGGRRP